jgi:hypothetical protein
MAIRIPKRLKLRPQWRGLPVPYIAMIKPDGTPDFRVTDDEKRRSVINNRWCQLCGEPLGKYFFFVGGTEAARVNAYFEPAAHMDCLIYAMQVCPFIVGKMEHVDLEKIQKQYTDVSRHATNVAGGVEIKADDNFAAVRNPYWIIKKATDWGYRRTPQGTILLFPEVVKATVPLHPETMDADAWKAVWEYLLQ